MHTRPTWNPASPTTGINTSTPTPIKMNLKRVSVKEKVRKVHIAIKSVLVRILYDDTGELVSVVEDGEHAPGKATQDEDGEGSNEEEEVLVIPTTYAVVHPRTMVIKILPEKTTQEEQHNNLASSHNMATHEGKGTWSQWKFNMSLSLLSLQFLFHA